MKVEQYISGTIKIEIYDDYIPKEQEKIKKSISDLNNYCIKLIDEIKNMGKQA